MKIKLIIIMALVFAASLKSQQIIVAGQDKLDKKLKSETVESIAKLITDNYVFPETGKQMAEHIKAKLKSGEYDKIEDPGEFSNTVTKDLQAISKDKHVSLRFNPQTAEQLLKQPIDISHDTTVPVFQLEEMRRNNFGFQKIEILAGNIAYINLTGFNMMKYTKPTLTAAMKLIENCDGVIFDLRQNGGGDGETVNLLCSYFLQPGININNAHFRNPDTTLESWTLKDIDGKRMLDVPVYLLTSGYTFSAAEEFAYDLQNEKRCTIIGETTGGGANPNSFFAVNSKFVLSSAIGQSINPISKANWEGVGVKPDIQTEQGKALDLAKMQIYESISQKSDDPRMKSRFSWLAENVKLMSENVTVDENVLKSYAGTYEDRVVTYENGKLYYQRKGRPKFAMIPFADDSFYFAEIDYFRIKFVKDASGNVTELTGMYDDGHNDKSVRN